MGLLAGLVSGHGEKTIVVENMLVGVFGAFIGGDFIVSMLNSGKVDDKVFHLSSLLIAIASAVAFLVVLRLMRKAVGPMRASKGPARRRD
ncbi:MAG: GlsB/YeaQ/YmgE family stress response membrane protein [Ramlibacter sp.]